MSIVAPFSFAYPSTMDEYMAFATARAYASSYVDTCREHGVDASPVPDGWPNAWLEYERRNPSSRMAMREGFRMWRDTRTLPGLPLEDVAAQHEPALEANLMEPVVIGTGELWWQSGERYTDRYGAVYLRDAAGRHLPVDTDLIGKRGRLVAVFQSRRPQRHIGDKVSGHAMTREIARGEVIELGSGTLFVEHSRFGDTDVGVKPDDGRTQNWLDPDALYNLHGQVVRLELHPEPPPGEAATDEDSPRGNCTRCQALVRWDESVGALIGEDNDEHCPGGERHELPAGMPG